MNDFDVDAVLSGTVEDITAKLADLTAEQRKALHNAEKAKGEGARVTLLDAIHRVDEAAVTPPVMAGAGATGDAAKPADAEKPSHDASKAPAPKKPAAAKAPAAKKPTAAKTRGAAPKDATVLSIDGEAGDLTPLLEYHEAALVVLADVAGKPIEGWPALEFPSDAFERAPAGVVLKEAIDMGIDLPRGDVSSAWLVVGNKPMAVSRLSMPLTAGGGRKAQFPANSRRFRTDG
jgi:hypothetical protein